MQILTADRKFETRSANPYTPWGSTAPPIPGSGGLSAAGTSVTTESAMQLAAVWGSIALISDSIATLPIRQWKLVAGEARPIDDANEAAVIHQPWPEITQRDFITQGTVSQLLRGNLYGEITARDERFYPAQVRIETPDRVKVTRNRETGVVEVRYGNRLVPPDDVTRAMGLSFPGGIVGLNPIEYMRNLLGLGRATDLYAGAFFSNSAEPRGVIQVKGDLDVNETKALAASWMEAHQGIGNAHLPAVLTGDAEFKPISMSHSDMEFLALMQWGQATIAGYVYRIPPHMFGVQDRSTSWGKGIAEQELGFVRNTLLVWLARWEDLLSSWLPPRQFVTFDLSERLRGDPLQRWQSYQLARVTGVMNAREIRDAEGLPRVDGDQAAMLERYDQPLNSSPMKPQQGDGGDDSIKPTEK